jgi:gluconate 2-dehydrogenase subunit 3-like protein
VRAENELPVIHDHAATNGRLTRREMVRRLLAGVGVSAAWPLVAASHPIHEHLADGAIFDSAEKLGAADWKPLFLDAQQEEALAALAEALIPGSRKAQSERFIDLLLSVDTAAHQKNFADSLAAFETESQKRFGKRFPALNADEQHVLLTDASTGEDKSGLRKHFEHLKGWISGAYYSSEPGMRELGWTEDRVFERFPGCEHPEGHH